MTTEAEQGPPTPEEVADLLRSCEFAIHHGRTSLVAFVDKQYIGAVERDFDRLGYVEKQIKAMLERLPPEEPMTPEQEAKVGAVVAAALNKRFGDGSAEQLREAMDEAWPSDGEVTR